jgi:hypothetical protein
MTVISSWTGTSTGLARSVPAIDMIVDPTPDAGAQGTHQEYPRHDPEP